MSSTLQFSKFSDKWLKYYARKFMLNVNRITSSSWLNLTLGLGDVMENALRSLFIFNYYITVPSISNGLLPESGYGEKLPRPSPLRQLCDHILVFFIVLSVSFNLE